MLARSARCAAPAVRSSRTYTTVSSVTSQRAIQLSATTYNTISSRFPPSSTQCQARRGMANASQDQVRKSIKAGNPPPHLKTLADLSVEQLADLVRTALIYKFMVKNTSLSSIEPSLQGKTIAMIFNKRSTRTRVASETSTVLLGGQPMFLGSQDIQLGVNETLADSAKVIGSMADGFMARVGSHDEIEELAAHSPVPVINALSDLYHPTQILADLLTLDEHYSPDSISSATTPSEGVFGSLLSYLSQQKHDPFAALKGKKMAWIGDTNNIINELLVTVPRLGMRLAVASPKGYDKVDPRVWARVEEGGAKDLVQLTNSPDEALKDADVVITDTWISMGQEEEKAARLEAFKGYQITNEMVERSGANPNWVFMHCLPRKQEEVNDEVFYGKRSLVFPEAENRKWTIMAVFDKFIGKWSI